MGVTFIPSKNRETSDNPLDQTQRCLFHQKSYYWSVLRTRDEGSVP